MVQHADRVKVAVAVEEEARAMVVVLVDVIAWSVEEVAIEYKALVVVYGKEVIK